ncbi:phosphatase PAP2 family protein [Lentzea sp. NEAU-D7]|uniref:phosphatase PAP2 family protein n=1 Tax=Lentzea sp. NEAU-D7 TaxID=2994667 RepID=UPI00224A6174|nr:phosphatase PAP2 family protein [Lentzea sp. NEAU-D7]MCX2948900.1 phosphatase PAP2 family protein [Lentzea sp. NEAU-D7]
MTFRPSPDAVSRAERFALGTVVGLALVTAAGVGFALLLTLVQLRWKPLHELDLMIAGGLNDLVAGNDIVVRVLTGVTDLGGTAMLLWVVTVGAAWLLIRRQPRLAGYAVVTAVGALVLNGAVKALVGRLRPVVDFPVAASTGMSFPSGHAMGSLVSYGVLLLIFLPVVPKSARWVFATLVGVVVVAVGFSRMALGAHFLSDVLAGWLLGLLWLGVTAVAFRRWGHPTTAKVTPLSSGLAPEAESQLRPVPRRHPPTLPHPWRGAAELVTAWVLLLGLLYGAGLLVSADGTGPVPLAWDHNAVTWLAHHRVALLDTFNAYASRIGSTGGVLAAAFVIGPLVLAITHSWRPVLFLTVVLVGEVSLFLTTTAIVSRSRPDVPQLNPNLPPTSSFPSGHVAAACALYAATALLVVSATRRWWKWLVVTATIALVATVAFTRLYAGVHYPTDVAGGASMALIWIMVCWWVIRPQGLMTGDSITQSSTED